MVGLASVEMFTGVFGGGGSTGGVFEEFAGELGGSGTGGMFVGCFGRFCGAAGGGLGVFDGRVVVDTACCSCWVLVMSWASAACRRRWSITGGG